MLGLPKATEFNKRIPKEKFYEKLNVTPTVKKCFVEQIKVIYWRNKIASTTTNLAAGTTVNEIEVFDSKAVLLMKGSCVRLIRKSRITSCFCWNTMASTKHGQPTRKHLLATLLSK